MYHKKLQQNMQFARYKILEEIGRGGMGIVYRAQEIGSDRVVALKVLLSQEFSERFLREARTASSLNHPNIIKIYSMGVESGYHFFAMEYIQGMTFDDYLKSEPPLTEILQTLIKIARALHIAHEQGLIHRDIKPKNILVSENGNPFITDFGLVKDLSQGTVTDSGDILGTPFYMSPEQIKGERNISCHSDIYSLGVILYQSLTGRLPFFSSNYISLYVKIVEESPLPPRKIRSDIPSVLQDICLKTLAKNKSQRYSSSHALARDLQRHLDDKPVRIKKIRTFHSKKIFLWASAIVFLSLLAWKFSHKDPIKSSQKTIHDITIKKEAINYFTYAEALMRQKFYDSALENLYLGLAKKPSGELIKQKQIHKKMVLVFAHLKYYKKAVEHYQKFLPVEDSHIWLALTKSHYFLQKYHHSQQYLSLFFQNKPQSDLITEAHYYQGALFYKQQKYAQALKHLEIVKAKYIDKEVQPSYFPMALFYLGVSLFKEDDITKATYYLQQANKTIKDFALLYEYLGNCFAKSALTEQDWQKVLYYFKKCVKLENRNSRYHQRLGAIWEKLKRYDKALNSYYHSMEINFHNFAALEKIAHCGVFDITLQPDSQFLLSRYGERILYSQMTFSLPLTNFKKWEHRYHPNYLHWKWLRAKKHFSPTNLLEKLAASDEVYSVAKQGLMALRHQPRLRSQFLAFLKRDIPKAGRKRIREVLDSIEKSVKREEMQAMYYSIARAHLYQDKIIIREMQQDIDKTIKILKNILIDKTTDTTIRYLAAEALLNLNNTAVLVLKKQMSSKNLIASIISKCVIKKAHFQLERSLQKNVFLLQDTFVKRLVAHHLNPIDNKEILVNFLENTDEKTRLYAAAKIFRFQSDNEEAGEILIKGMENPSDVIRKFSHLSFWRSFAKKEQYQKYQDKFVSGLNDPSDKVKMAVAICGIMCPFEEHTNEVAKLLKSPDGFVQICAIFVMAKWNKTQYMKKIISQQKYSPIVRILTFALLMPRDPGFILKYLLKAVRDPDVYFRSVLYYYSGKIGLMTLHKEALEENEIVKANILATGGYPPRSLTSLLFKDTKSGNFKKYLGLYTRYFNHSSLNLRRSAAIGVVSLIVNYKPKELDSLCQKWILLKDPALRQGLALGLYLQIKRKQDLGMQMGKGSFVSENYQKYRINDLLVSKRKQEFVRLLSWAIRFDERPNYRYERAIICRGIRQYQKAKNDIEKVLSMAPNNTNYLIEKVHICIARKENQQAITTLKLILQTKNLGAESLLSCYRLAIGLKLEAEKKQIIEQLHMFDIARKNMFDPQKYYKIECRFSKKCLTARSKRDGDIITQWEYKGEDEQKWKIQLVGKGIYKIINKYNGKCLEVLAMNTIAGSPIGQWEYRALMNQKWRIITAQGSYSRLMSYYSGKCVDVYSFNKENGGKVVQWSYQGLNNQQWSIVPAD